MKRLKGSPPDIERALSIWVRNKQKEGVSLSDEDIRDKARVFATSVSNPNRHSQANNAVWLEKFKQKNNIDGSKTRKKPLAAEGHRRELNTLASPQLSNGMSPTSMTRIEDLTSPITTTVSKSNNEIRPETPSGYVELANIHGPIHSQSNTSLSSVFTDSAPSPFSQDPKSPTSPFFIPDSASNSSPFLTSLQDRSTRRSNHMQRQRSQTFPLHSINEQISPPMPSNTPTPGHIRPTTCNAPVPEMPPPLSIDEVANLKNRDTITLSSIQILPPSHRTTAGGRRSEQISPSGSPSQADARRALEVVIDFVRQQPTGFVEPQEHVAIGRLMEKLRM
ncbi:hypothetical protein LTR04_005302 [Oleoguttula sp. CCFEE 6159]|nr:hypothetical protein LTR04_005302 [Oleoguttula sp. CCFEE 6159]